MNSSDDLTLVHALAAMVIISAAITSYFLPFTIARLRRHRKALAIFMLNLLLGWTAVAWVAAIIWACNSNTGARSFRV